MFKAIRDLATRDIEGAAGVQEAAESRSLPRRYCSCIAWRRGNPIQRGQDWGRSTRFACFVLYSLAL